MGKSRSSALLSPSSVNTGWGRSQASLRSEESGPPAGAVTASEAARAHGHEASLAHLGPRQQEGFGPLSSEKEWVLVFPFVSLRPLICDDRGLPLTITGYLSF